MECLLIAGHFPSVYSAESPTFSFCDIFSGASVPLLDVFLTDVHSSATLKLHALLLFFSCPFLDKLDTVLCPA